MALGCATTAWAWNSERTAAKERDRHAVELASSSLSGLLQQTVAALRGADGLATDGVVSDVEFAAFAADVMRGSLFRALAYSIVVPDEDLTQFEQRTGIEVRDTDGAGGFVSGAHRVTHIVVEHVHPVNDTTAALPGFDIASDQGRADAATRAAQTGTPAIGEPIRLASSARPGVFAIQAVRSTEGTVIGYVSSGVSVDDLLATAARGQAEGRRVSLLLDEVPLAGPGRGASMSFDVGGRTITVRADDPDDIHLVLPVLAALGTLLLATTLGLVYRRDRALVSAQARQTARHRAVSELGERLAAATTVDDVISEVLDHAGSIMGAAYTNVARHDEHDPGTLLVCGDANLANGLDDERAVHRLDARLPLVDSVRDSAPVVVRDLIEYRLRYPHLIDDAIQAGIESVICVPLLFQPEYCFGAIGFAWTTPQARAGNDDVLTAASTIGQLTARALERAVSAGAVQDGADRLRTLAQALAAAATVADVAVVVKRFVPGVVGAVSATLEPAERPDVRDPLDALEDHPRLTPLPEALARDCALPAQQMLRQPVVDGTDESTAGLVLVWHQQTALSPTVHAITQAIAEMVGQTLARAHAYDQEHELVVELQRAVLPPPPIAPGVDIAVRYEPAATVVGLGGDWYDIIISRADRLYLVIGDVTGHGAEAVALMAQLKAVIAHLLRVDTDLHEVFDHATDMLAATAVYATAHIVEIDVQAGQLSYLNAGHPYALLRRRAGSVELLTGAHRPLLGVPFLRRPDQPFGVECVTFEPGDAVLLYTDGLIERRGSPLDVQMDQLAISLETLGAEAPAVSSIDQLVQAARASALDSTPTDDDVAVILARRTS